MIIQNPCNLCDRGPIKQDECLCENYSSFVFTTKKPDLWPDYVKDKDAIEENVIRYMQDKINLAYSQLQIETSLWFHHYADLEDQAVKIEFGTATHKKYFGIGFAQVNRLTDNEIIEFIKQELSNFIDEQTKTGRT